MIVQYCSDLHLEFKENKKYLLANPLQPAGNILVLAGDIVPFAIMKEYDDFFDLLSDSYDTVYWLPGNHEYYSSDAAERSGTLHEKIRSNVFLVNNISVLQGDTKLIFSTLWSRISPINEWEIERCLNDFHLIRYHGARFSAAHFNQMHADGLDFIRREVQQEHGGKVVVVSHHVPTLQHYPKVYKNSILNEAFATELFDFIGGAPVDYWIYGHHHHRTPDFTIGRTCLLTNQLGYVKNREHRGFNRGRVIEFK
jgi:predicted phosphohydrolase